MATELLFHTGVQMALGIPASHIQIPRLEFGLYLDSNFLQVHTQGAAGESTNIWVFATCVAGLDWISWFQTDPVATVSGMWGENQITEVCVCLCLCVCVSFTS